MANVYTENVRAERRPLTPFIVGGLAALAFLGCFLDWMTVLGGLISLQGTDFDRGLIVMGLTGVIVLLIGLHLADRLRAGAYALASMALAVAGFLVMVWVWVDVENAGQPSAGTGALFGSADLVTVGPGVYVTTLALVAIVITLTVRQVREALSD